VRLTWYVISVERYLADPRGLGAAYREIIGSYYPAMATIEVTRLVEPKALVEIEATAVIP
jgi:enamine deaminase RidA (YjgF/YER057c/UK114 family)